MATIGWLGEQTVNSWGRYNSRLTTNVYINGTTGRKFIPICKSQIQTQILSKTMKKSL